MLSIVLSTAVLGLASPSHVPAPVQIPTILMQSDTHSVITPNWSAISFATLPLLQTSGFVQGRRWKAKQPLEQVLTLGDFADSFKLQDLNLYAIAIATQNSPKTHKLSEFKLFQHQTLADLAIVLPTLQQLPVNQVAPLADLLKTAKPTSQLAAETLPQLLEQDPTLGALSFQNFDLSKYRLNEIPGLMEAPLQAFRDWQKATISEIPGLSSMTWQNFPHPPSDGGLGGVVQLPTSSQLAPAESLSGSDVAGYQVSCPTCLGISFSHPTSLQGKRWISGLAQWVPGGTGRAGLSQTNQEPTGRNVFGKAFKVVVTEVTPKAAKTAFYFRFCDLEGNQTHCSPYKVGPMPFLAYHAGDGMPLGRLDGESASSFIPEPLDWLINPQPIELPDPIQLPSQQTWLTQLMRLVGRLFNTAPQAIA